MRRLPLAVLSICFPIAAFAGAKEDGLEIFNKFINGFNSAKAEDITKLFAPEALFWGTRATDLITTSQGIQQYFTNTFKVIPGAKASIVGDPSVAALTNDAVAISGLWQITADIEGKPTVIPLRNSIAAVKRGDQWLIVSFHNSPRPTQ